MYFALAIVIMMLSVVICHVVAKNRGKNPVFWGVMGALFGPLAIPFVFFPKSKHTA